MARDIICDLCHVEVAIVLIGNTQTGEQVAFCAGCRILDCLGTLDQQLNADAKAAVATQWAPAAEPPKDAEAGNAERPKSRRGGRRGPRLAGSDPADVVTALQAAPQAAEAQAQEPDRGLAEAPTAADDG